MLKRDETGAVSGVGISLVLTVLLLIGVIAFAAWAFSSRQDYKDNTDAKINDAVKIAKQQESSAKDAAFAQEEKNPLKPYNGPEAYGSINMQYPKTWSGYVAIASDSNGGNGTPLDGYFYPGVVPSTTDQSSIFATRVQVINKSYAETVNDAGRVDSQSPAAISAYALPKLPKIVGVKVVGSLPVSNGSGNKTGEMIILPLRSATIELWTEGNQFQSDFENIILPNFSFSP